MALRKQLLTILSVGFLRATNRSQKGSGSSLVLDDAIRKYPVITRYRFARARAVCEWRVMRSEGGEFPARTRRIGPLGERAVSRPQSEEEWPRRHGETGWPCRYLPLAPSTASGQRHAPALPERQVLTGAALG